MHGRHFAVLTLLSVLPTVAQALGTGISGREVFPGISLGRYTLDTTFAGWTTDDQKNRSDWLPISETSGGSWFASISYQGDARVPGQKVQIMDGLWSLQLHQQSYGGKVVGGTIHWPKNDGSATVDNWPCWSSANYTFDSYPVATVDAMLNVAGKVQQGSVTGCLDDIRWNSSQPLENVPHIWGVINIGARPVPLGSLK